ITPGGTVSFSTNASGSFSPSTSCTLAAGSCTVSYTGNAVGSHTITAAYGGDADHTASSGSKAVPFTYSNSGVPGPGMNPSTVNMGHGGRTYPLTWQLQTADGSFISDLSAVTSITYGSTSCSAFSTDPTNSMPTSSTGNTTLRYDSTSNQFVYNWKTPG